MNDLLVLNSIELNVINMMVLFTKYGREWCSPCCIFFRKTSLAEVLQDKVSDKTVKRKILTFESIYSFRLINVMGEPSNFVNRCKQVYRVVDGCVGYQSWRGPNHSMGTHSKPREEFTLSGGVILYSKYGMWNNKEWNDFVEKNNSPQQGLNQQIKASTK